jgi:hypothetical protein
LLSVSVKKQNIIRDWLQNFAVIQKCSQPDFSFLLLTGTKSILKLCILSGIFFCFLTLTDSNFSAISWQEQVNFQWDSSLDWPYQGSNPWSTHTKIMYFIRDFSSLPQGQVTGPFRNEKYSKIKQNSQNFHSHLLILINFSNIMARTS